jgi:hypothetical protein
MGSPSPTSTYASSLSRTRRRFFWWENVDEIMFAFSCSGPCLIFSGLGELFHSISGIRPSASSELMLFTAETSLCFVIASLSRISISCLKHGLNPWCVSHNAAKLDFPGFASAIPDIHSRMISNGLSGTDYGPIARLQQTANGRVLKSSHRVGSLSPIAVGA